jgi:hypothetical protein
MSIDRAMERVARSRVGQGILSVLIVMLVGATVAWNLPPGSGPGSAAESSALRTGVLRVGAPVLYALGLDQEWGVFAPPRQQVIGLEARIEYADGTQGVWRPPALTGALFGAYRDYRWAKYIEQEIPDASARALWEPLAAWVARTHSSSRRRPLAVSLIRRWYDLLPVAGGRKPARGPWRQYLYYVYRVPTMG